MTDAVVQFGVGSRLVYDGEHAEVIEMLDRDVLLRTGPTTVRRVSLITILSGESAGVRLLSADGEVIRVDDGDDPVAEVLGQLDESQLTVMRERASHVREVLTGYRSGSPDLALAGEPRNGFGAGTTLTGRYAAKAAELGVAEVSVRRWVRAYRFAGEAGLVDGRASARSGPLGSVDGRWLEACQAVLAEQVEGSTRTKSLILRAVAARIARDHGEDVVPIPRKSKAYQVLTELGRGRSMWSNSKARRSIANRPTATYGRLEAVRPGEYVLLDTTRLDVFAMDAITLRWVQVELTVGIDLYSRCVTGLRLTPVSTKSIDVASVVHQAFQPASVPAQAAGSWPCHGVPSALVVPVDKLVGQGAGIAALAPETLVVDHGKIYVSEHLSSACARLGISIQPARPYTPTDKAPVERFFRTLREDLLQALPGYKGPDVFNRGRDVENEAFFFLHELEDILREWVALVYHRRPHDGLIDPHVPGLKLSPAQMFAHGVARSGYIQIPSSPEFALEFLPVKWTSIQHYGVEVGTLRYNGDGVSDYRNRRSPYLGRHAGRWPIRFNPDDASTVWFRDPKEGTWHPLTWEHAGRFVQPFSFEALGYARRLARATDRFPDTVGALDELLGRWNAGFAATPAERRMALRHAADRAALDLPAAPVSALPSVRAALGESDATGTDEDDLTAAHLVVDVGDLGASAPAHPAYAVHTGPDDEVAATGRADIEEEPPGGDDDDGEFEDETSDFYADAVEPLL